MPNISVQRRVTDKFKLDDELLKISRICLAVFFVFIGFGVLAPTTELGLYDPQIIRIIHSLIMVCLFFSTYFSKWVKDHLELVLNTVFYSMTIHSFILLYWNDLYIGYLIGMVLVITCIGISFVQKRWLITYLFFVIIASIVVGLSANEPQVDLSLFFPTIITPALVSYLTLNIRLSAVEKLKESEIQLKEFYSRTSEDLLIAQNTQKSLVTIQVPDSIDFKMSTYYRSYDKVGGDVLSVEVRPDKRLNIFFADVSGHGIASAMVSAMASLAFKIVSRSNMQPAESLLIMHELLKPLVLNHHISACFAIMDTQNNRIEYSYAGHPQILLIRNKHVIEMEGRGSLILSPLEPSLRDYHLDIEPGDKFLFYSDGLVELFNESGEFYGEDKFFESILANLSKKGKALLEAVVGDSIVFAEGHIEDDMTMLLIEMKNPD